MRDRSLKILEDPRQDSHKILSSTQGCHKSLWATPAEALVLISIQIGSSYLPSELSSDHKQRAQALWCLNGA